MTYDPIRVIIPLVNQVMEPHMRVTNKVKADVTRRIEECIVIANKKYGRTFDFPTVKYTKRGTTAGTANDGTYTINLNPVLLMENLDTFIDRTVVHEFAHLVDGLVNSWTRDTSIRMTSRGYSRTKRTVHGPSWKAIMVLSGADPSRCHSYDVTNARVKGRRAHAAPKHIWKCGCGGGEIKLTAKNHKKQLAAAPGYGYYARGHTVRRCGKYSHFGLEGAELKPMPLPRAADAPKPKPRTGTTKLDKCRRVWNPDHTRAANIVAFIEEGCTPAGAATYYAKIKKEF